MSDTDFIATLYENFNGRNIDAVVCQLTQDVAWANGMDGGHVHGHDALRAYWLAQWTTIDPHVDPKAIVAASDGTFAVDVHQVVRDLEGVCLLDEMVRHVFTVRDGRICRFDIESGSGLSSLVHASDPTEALSAGGSNDAFAPAD